MVTAEINPPRSANAEAVRKQARDLRGVVDAANVTDCTRGTVRLSSTAGAILVRDEGVEPVVEMTCRDRNQIALQSELLGLSALGLHNVLLLTGDDPSQGDHPDAKAVFALNGTNLLAAANAMRQGTLPRLAQPWLVPRWITMSPARTTVSPSSRISVISPSSTMP